MSDADDVPESDAIDEDLLAAIQQSSAAQPINERARLARATKELREQREFYRSVLASEIGRRELWRILDAGHPFETKFACGPNGFPQPEATWFHHGAQDHALRLFFTLQRIDPEGVLTMQQEHDPRFAKPRPSRKPKAA